MINSPEHILSETSLARAANAATNRNALQRGASRHDGKVMASSIEADLTGAEGELAVSEYLGVTWDGEIKDIDEWDTWKLEGNDVKGLEVRTTRLGHGSLILHPNDKNGVPYILVTAAERPKFKIVGWLLAEDGKQSQYWREDVPRPCYMVPQASLKPINLLLDAVNSRKEQSTSLAVIEPVAIAEAPVTAVATKRVPTWQGFSKFESFDTETHLLQKGLLCPPLVCGSFARYPEFRVEGAFLLSKEDTLAQARRLLTVATDTVIVMANGAFDFGVLANEEPDLLRPIFDAYRAGRVYDLLIGQALDAVAGGHLSMDPRTGGPLSNNGKQTTRYSLNVCTDLTLNRQDAKHNDLWRKRYAVLERVPMHLWPAEAVQYPKDDAINQLEVGLTHMGIIPSPGYTQPNVLRNLADQAAQAETAFDMHLGAMWGIRTNRARVEALSAKVEEVHRKMIERFTEVGFVVPPVDELGKPNKNAGKEDGQAVRRAVARAYGASGVCEICQGTGEVPSRKQVPCRGVKVRARFQGCLRDIREQAVYTSEFNCEVCKDKGEITKLGALINCAKCDSTGYNLGTAPTLPRTAGNGVSKSRDTLLESGDDVLTDYGDNEAEKIKDTYIPFLREGLDRPINLRPNVLVASGRTSYDGLIQLIPRGGGVRDCFEARPGYWYCSVDYSALELCSLSQVCLWVVGYSKMADTINSTKDPGSLHTAFAAQMIGVSVDEMKARVKAGDKEAKGYRQASKAANFGFPGGMGAAKLVLSKRTKNDGMTEGPDGRKYVGIRFCILIGGQRECGVEKITSYRKRDIPPTCIKCIEVVEQQLKPAWFQAWPEMAEYFKWIKNATEAQDGELPCLGPWIKQGGETHRVRGGLGFCDGANTLFQGLAADGAKNALRQVTRECYLDEESPLYGTRPIMFVHDEIFSEMPIEKAHLAGPRKSELMVSAMREYIPDVFIHAAPALSEFWYKDCEPVFTPEGKLTVWKPKEKKLILPG